MPNRYNWMSDTSPEAFAKLVELLQGMPPAQRLRQSLQLSGMLMRLSEGDVRRQCPNATEREVFLRAAARRLGRDTMIRAYGWDPTEHDARS
jgi:hypothetical protein